MMGEKNNQCDSVIKGYTSSTGWGRQIDERERETKHQITSLK